MKNWNRWKKEKFIYSWVIHILLFLLFIVITGLYPALQKIQNVNVHKESIWFGAYLTLMFIPWFFIVFTFWASFIVGLRFQMYLLRWGLWPKLKIEDVRNPKAPFYLNPLNL